MKKTLLATLTTAILASGMTQATNYPAGTITFTGTVTGTTCTFTLTGAGTSGSTVTLDPVAVSSFTGVNSEAGQKAFTVAVTGCGSITNLQAMFDGTVDANQTDAFANGAVTSPATGVAVRLKDDTAAAFTPGTAATKSYSLVGGAVDMNLTAQYVQTTSTAPGQGNVSAITTLNVAY